MSISGPMGILDQFLQSMFSAAEKRGTFILPLPPYKVFTHHPPEEARRVRKYGSRDARGWAWPAGTGLIFTYQSVIRMLVGKISGTIQGRIVRLCESPGRFG
jgi:hypothetical protein